MPAPSSVYYVIDWRSQEHFAAGHIEGAVRMDLASIVDNLEQIPSDRIIVNVCYTGQTASVATAVLNMLGQEMGFNAANLKFGMHGWTYPGNSALLGSTSTYPTEDDWVTTLETRSHDKPAAGSLPALETTADNQLETLRERAEMFVNGHADQWFVPSYFPATNFDGSHIPGAVRCQPKSDLQSTTFLKTLPTDKKIAV